MMISEGSKLEEEPLHAFATMKPPPISVAADDVATAGDDERSTPLLFNKLNSAKCKRWRHSAEQHYEMHVVSIDTFLELSTLPPHQELKAAGKLTVYSPALEGRIVFASVLTIESGRTLSLVGRSDAQLDGAGDSQLFYVVG